MEGAVLPREGDAHSFDDPAPLLRTSRIMARPGQAKARGSKRPGAAAQARLDRPFVGIPSFLRSAISLDLDALDAAIAVMGVPFDEGSPFLAGSRLGPRALREHS